jgi:hypothetical protein
VANVEGPTEYDQHQLHLQQWRCGLIACGRVDQHQQPVAMWINSLWQCGLPACGNVDYQPVAMWINSLWQCGSTACHPSGAWCHLRVLSGAKAIATESRRFDNSVSAPMCAQVSTRCSWSLVGLRRTQGGAVSCPICTWRLAAGECHAAARLQATHRPRWWYCCTYSETT